MHHFGVHNGISHCAISIADDPRDGPLDDPGVPAAARLMLINKPDLLRPVGLAVAPGIGHSSAGSVGRRVAPLLCLVVPLLLVLAALACGCAAQSNPGALPAADAQAATQRIYVVRHGWHSGIVVRAADVPLQAWPARREFAGADYLELGWGDRAYYQAPDPSVWLGLRALLWPTAGVLHIVAFDGPVERHFMSAEIVALQITPQGLARLVAAVSASHELDATGQPVRLGPGLYGKSRFYASRDNFHLFSTCNVWLAALLREAGVRVSPTLSQTSGALFAQLRRLDATLQAAP